MGEKSEINWSNKTEMLSFLHNFMPDPLGCLIDECVLSELTMAADNMKTCHK